MEKKKRQVAEEIEVPVLNLTPMIDVVFQLIIFFMCAMRFKTLDRKLEAELPKDRGPDPRIVPRDVPVPVKVLLRQTDEEGIPHLIVVGQEIRPDLGPGVAPLVGPPAGSTRQDREAFEARRRALWERLYAPKLAELERRAREYRARDPDLVFHLDASPRVKHEFVVGVLDTFVAAGIDSVEIRGIAAPGPGR